MSKVINIPGWQSWSPCTPNLLSKFATHFYSPHGQTSWQIKSSSHSKTQTPIAGWCSFYAFGRNIDEQKIISNAQVLSSIPTQMPKHLIVDDGWCKWGDWLHPKINRFPSGMKSLAQQIKHLGLKPGLWFAPFLTDFPTPNRLPVFPYKYFLDLENSQDYRQTMNFIKTSVDDWGFQLLKLDFLYSQHHLKRYKDPKVPDEILRNFLLEIRRACPKIHLNISGCPLGPAVGIADSMRISADIITPYLDNIWPINKIYHTSRLNHLENNLSERFSSNKFWLLDPDAFVCRQSLGLSPSQISKLQSLIKKANGVYFLGDDLTRLTPDQIDTYIRPLFHA